MMIINTIKIRLYRVSVTCVPSRGNPFDQICKNFIFFRYQFCSSFDIFCNLYSGRDKSQGTSLMLSELKAVGRWWPISPSFPVFFLIIIIPCVCIYPPLGLHLRRYGSESPLHENPGCRFGPIIRAMHCGSQLNSSPWRALCRVSSHYAWSHSRYHHRPGTACQTALANLWSQVTMYINHDAQHIATSLTFLRVVCPWKRSIQGHATLNYIGCLGVFVFIV